MNTNNQTSTVNLNTGTDSSEVTLLGLISFIAIGGLYFMVNYCF